MGDEELKKSQISILNTIKDADLNLKLVVLEANFEIGQLTNLSTGSVLIFDNKENAQMAKVKVNNRVFAKGNVVQVGERYGILIKDLV